jgi:prefoldin subunit 5
MDLSPETPVTFTMRQIYWVVGSLGAAAIAVLVGGIGVWTVGGVREDVKDIREHITRLQGGDSDNVRRIADVNVKLSEQIQGLHSDLNNLHSDITGLGTQFKYFSDKLDTVNKSIAGLDNRIDKFDAQLASTQAAWSDPKAAATFVENLKKAGVESDRIIVVPLTPSR